MSYFIVFFTVIPITIITMIIPYITRKTECFGVSIPEEIYSSKELIVMRKKYVFLTGILSLIICIFVFISWLIGNENWVIQSLLVSIIGFSIGSFLIYLKFHNQMKKLKASNDWRKSKTQSISIDTRFHSQKKTYSNGWLLISFVIAIASIIITILFYKEIPNRMPMKYDFKGNVTNWVDKNYWSVFQLPLIQLFLTGLFLYLNQIISRSKQQINASNPEKSMKQNVIFRRRWSLFLIVTSILMSLMFFLIQLSFIININQNLLQGFSLGLVGIIILLVIIISVTTGQGGSRVKIKNDFSNNKINYDDDRFWKLGVFYFNPNDPSLWVEKRFGTGWTINLARPIGWMVMITIILIPIIISLTVK
ncbi:DUF1648 domain-containing protein [Heyndrickxia sp. NPDC080065]|uniref:DUF1648 domain-containing protein n=1 Tax=Heyndrickxia sp. NPDC080065 TaxID=3390568 RepID=UPI003D000600